MMIKRHARHARRTAAGFSMIEVLIALVVLAVGLLGLALLQTMNLRYTKSAQQRTQAINLASELLDTIRANRSELTAYEAITTTSFPVVVPQPGGCATSAVLTSANNIARWQCEVNETLGPEATAEVIFEPATNVISVRVIWDESLMPNLVNGGEITLETQI